ncbi:hypothetical protein PV735_31965 [Streptomyces turgidiscabies]|uniref:Uncharacterized protein n=1 Tax=Streptomyces turgidiscabies (strain Car8) TaxID=698760 RepID=L7ERJ9_STRT8|nr:hypothetical protein [Streptomyces turgidiscabies]ELP61524.1 hypothetical protein STRTUCAR8_03668 [Streptomyces turgidiscabies Car8]MDX3497269.1 hypothetical protein [Streptomyces turgidiscabies]GAQ68634.1 hypothetical protein T45_00346 [Streptomyces turgidiscabies]
MSPTDIPLIHHPAGTDEALRVALEDLLLGRWLSTRDLLAATARDRALRTSRSQVLALYAAQGDAVSAWCQEEPGNGDAVMMRARVLTQRALDLRGERSGLGAAEAARQACLVARERLPVDPVPVVCLLALAQLDVDPRYRRYRDNWEPAADSLLPAGPWKLLDWANQLDPPYSREAHHRVLQCLHARGSGALGFARWVSRDAEVGSSLLVLPLYAYVEDYRRQRQAGTRHSRGPIGYWTSEAVQDMARKARDYWFYPIQNLPPDERPARSLADLNHLACILVKAGLPGLAGQVFREIGPYATAAPWAQVSESAPWQDHFHRARAFALRKEPARG